MLNELLQSAFQLLLLVEQHLGYLQSQARGVYWSYYQLMQLPPDQLEKAKLPILNRVLKNIYTMEMMTFLS